ncbi:hypothetical protein HBI96_122650 [Parastagonospora nodorum]|nr:hypothetical protein HBI96_122650 [Parastagonospora nodorum]
MLASFSVRLFIVALVSLTTRVIALTPFTAAFIAMLIIMPLHMIRFMNLLLDSHLLFVALVSYVFRILSIHAIPFILVTLMISPFELTKDEMRIVSFDIHIRNHAWQKKTVPFGIIFIHQATFPFAFM